MRGITGALRIWLFVAIGVVGPSESHPNLRGGGVRTMEQGRRTNVVHVAATTRRMQELAGAVVNALVSMVTPALSSKIAYVVDKHYRDYNLEWVQESGILSGQRLGSSQTKEQTNVWTTCGDSDLEVDVGFAVNAVSGLGNMTIETIQFVPGSQNIALVTSDFRIGSTWAGQWVVNVWVPQLIATTTTTFNTSCNATGIATINEIEINGTTIFNDIEATVVATVTGDTERVIFFLTSSQLSTANIDTFAFHYENMDITNTFGEYATASLSFDAVEVFKSRLADEVASQELNEYFRKLYVTAMQDEINWILPRSLLGDGYDGRI